MATARVGSPPERDPGKPGHEKLGGQSQCIEDARTAPGEEESESLVGN